MNRRELVQSLRLSGGSLSEFAFQLGYVGFQAPKLLRKIGAKSRFHASWLSGYYGGGICGIMDRQQETPAASGTDPGKTAGVAHERDSQRVD